MKTLIVVRHAKSSWANLGQPDFERPLNDRGKNDAPKMAKRLKKGWGKPELLVSSPAKRALATCKLFAEELGYKKEKILEVPELYHAPQEVFYKVVHKLPDDVSSAAVFSHNPGITDFVNSLIPGANLDNMPTCAVFVVEANTTQWAGFESAGKRFVMFDYPKREEA